MRSFKTHLKQPDASEHGSKHWFPNSHQKGNLTEAEGLVRKRPLLTITRHGLWGLGRVLSQATTREGALAWSPSSPGKSWDQGLRVCLSLGGPTCPNSVLGKGPALGRQRSHRSEQKKEAELCDVGTLCGLRVMAVMLGSQNKPHLPAGPRPATYAQL